MTNNSYALISKRTTELGYQEMFSYILYWLGAVYFFILIRFGGHIEQLLSPVNNQLNILFHDLLVMGLFTGVVSGLVMWKLDKVFDKRRGNYVSTLRLIVIKSVVYFAAFLSIIALINFGYYIGKTPLFHFNSWLEIFLSYNTLIFMIYAYGVVLSVTVIKYLKGKVGKKRIIDLMTGSLYSSKETEKIFMFLDLNSATRLAEHLGNQDYSMLLKDCFEDLNTILSNEAEVYQYVGDEVVLCWDLKDKEQNLDCIKTYFRFSEKLINRSNHYFSQYGIAPTFKAGVHQGKVVSTEVGLNKRDFAFHGDAINTASRIRDLCRGYQARIIISKDLASKVQRTDQYSFDNLGLVGLRGKKQKIALYSVSDQHSMRSKDELINPKQENREELTVEVFKTNIKDDSEASLVKKVLSQSFGYAKITFDLEDCDHILRIEAYEINPKPVIKVLETLKIQCEVLED